MSIGAGLLYPPALMQEFDEDSIQTKIIRSLLIIISTILPTFLLFDGFLRTFDWINILICLLTCLLNAYLVLSINQHKAAAYLPSFLFLSVCYLIIGVRCTGTEPTLSAGVNDGLDHDYLLGSAARRQRFCQPTDPRRSARHRAPCLTRPRVTSLSD